MPDAMVKTRAGLFLPTDLARERVSARYDAARTTPENARHWANSDALSANAANSPGVRKTLVRRSRYERDNSSYVKGIISTLGNDTVGAGPRLQMHTGEEDLNDRIEQDWQDWADAVQMAIKLNTMRQAKACDGEGFGLLVNNSRLRTDSGVQLDIHLIETEMVASSLLSQSPQELETDGVRLDRYGNPVSYTVLPEHPGSLSWTKSLAQSHTVPEQLVLHYFNQDRPGQVRGVPETTPILPLCAVARRWTMSTVLAAENIANIAGVITTNVQTLVEDAEETATVMEAIEMERNKWLTLPEGWNINQPKAEQPTATYAEFKHEILNEMGRPWSMPYNIVAGNSSTYNYASGRLDHQNYFKSIEVEHGLMRLQVLRKIFQAWIWEWQLQNGVMLQRTAHEWFWDGFVHIDPQKEANAALVRLRSGTTTLQREYARQGLDWRKEQTKAAESFGLTLEEYQRRLTASVFEQPLIINEGQSDEETQRK